MKDCKIARQVAEWNPQGKRRRRRKGRIRYSVQRRNLKDEYFDREL
jgi:hypothetical protein